MTIRARISSVLMLLLVGAAIPAHAQQAPAPPAQQAPAPPAQQAPAAPAQPAVAAAAFPTFEGTGGYQFVHGNDLTLPFGLNVDAAWNVNRSIGLVAEIGWAMGSYDFDESLLPDVDVDLWTFAVGPRWNARTSGTVWPFAQVLVGAAHARTSTEIFGEDVSGNDTRLMLQPGVGVNFIAGDGWGIVTQVDYRRVFLDEDESGDSGENQFRVFAGVRLLLD